VRGSVALLRVATNTNDENDLVYRFEQGLRLITGGHDSLNLVRNTLVNLTVQVQSNDLKERFANRLFVTFPSDTIVRYARARLWTVQGKHLPEAAAIFQAYLSLPKPPTGGVGFAGVHWRLGQVYEKLGQTPDALTEYERSVALVPHPADAEKDAERLRKKLGK
jgi:tetratricopeptide (TPR) repeat protein